MEWLILIAILAGVFWHALPTLWSVPTPEPDDDDIGLGLDASAPSAVDVRAAERAHAATDLRARADVTRVRVRLEKRRLDRRPDAFLASLDARAAVGVDQQRAADRLKAHAQVCRPRRMKEISRDGAA